MRFLAGAAALGMVVAVTSAFAATGHSQAPTRVHSSALLFNGRIRCSASVATPARVGEPLHVRFRLRNISKHPVRVMQDPEYGTWLVTKGSDSATFDTRLAGGWGTGALVDPVRIAPGKTLSGSLAFRVRWSGPLEIAPGCGGTVVGPTGAKGPTGASGPTDDSKHLGTLHVPVAPTSAPADGRAAVAAVVAASGHLLDNCRPRVPAVAVDGVLNAPDGKAPPMHVRCVVRVTRRQGFDLAQELIVTPPSLNVHLRRAYGQLTWPRRHGNWEAVAWEFVVTRNRAVTVSEDDIYGIKPGKHGSAIDWQWTRSGPTQGDGGGNCRFISGGGSGDSFGGGGPDVVWISACG